MNPLFISFKILNYEALAIYEYNDFIRQLVYQYKGCFDYELSASFISNFAKEIKFLFKDYLIIPIPSFIGDDEKRGYNHVFEIFKLIGLKMHPILEKTEQHKQATSNVKGREKIYHYLRLIETPDLRKTKVLIVDDIYTTGSTIRAAINLVEKLNPKTIKVLVIAKTRPKKVK